MDTSYIMKNAFPVQIRAHGMELIVPKLNTSIEQQQPLRTVQEHLRLMQIIKLRRLKVILTKRMSIVNTNDFIVAIVFAKQDVSFSSILNILNL